MKILLQYAITNHICKLLHLYQINVKNTCQLITQCKGVICHPFKTAKIIVFDHMKYKSPNVLLQEELPCWSILMYMWYSRLCAELHSASGWMRGVQVKLWDPLRTRAIPERLRGVFTTRRYINTRLPYLYLIAWDQVLLSNGNLQCNNYRLR